MQQLIIQNLLATRSKLHMFFLVSSLLPPFTHTRPDISMVSDIPLAGLVQLAWLWPLPASWEPKDKDRC